MLSVVAAVLLDLLVGDPYWFPHPVRLIGLYINGFERLARRLAKSDFGLKTAGIVLTLSTVAFSYLIPFWVLKVSRVYNSYLYYTLNIAFMYTCLAAKCLGGEGIKIYRKLQEGDLEKARKMTGWIVGRDTANLDEKQVTRAVVETVSENSSDGIITPLFYMVIGGAPLALAYKAINTMDSMVGYKNEKYISFGWASARFDDLVNFIPARITALLISISALLLDLNYKESLAITLKDGRNHSSPKSGYPEAAAAGALGVQLGGTNFYFGKPVYKPTIGKPNKSLDKQDILKTVKLMYGAYFIAIIIFTLIYLVSR